MEVGGCEVSQIGLPQFWAHGDKVVDVADLTDETVEYLLWRAGFKPVSN